MNILALDLGTNTGWASWLDGKLSLGHLELGTPKEVKAWKQMNWDRRCDPRIRRLYEWCQGWKELVVFEDVEFCQNTYQCQLWSALRAAVWCAFKPEQIESVPVHVIKRFATGNAKAEKIDMAVAAARQDPQRFLLDQKSLKTYSLYDRTLNRCMTSDEVDAYWILQWAKLNVVR